MPVYVRRAARCLAVVSALGVLAACLPTGVTAHGLERAIGPTFAHLYVLQQSKLGHPPITVTEMHPNASCTKGGPATPDTGAGNQWRCIITWRVAGVDTPARAIYRVEVRTNGRYIADGEGPRPVNGLHTVVATDGTRVANPLWQFDGVLDTT